MAPAGKGAESERLKARPAQKPVEKEVSAPAPAILVVTLPVDAKLTIDDTATTSTSATRRFASPVLEPGQNFYYTLKGQLARDGRVFTASRRVTVRAGQETRVSLDFPEGQMTVRKPAAP
jgi:uncharacterized protein (TIGR03000 family)